MRRWIVITLVAWFCLFGFFWAGLRRRDAAMEPGLNSKVTVFHHRLARFFAIPFSRNVRNQGNAWTVNYRIASAWGATVWTTLGAAFIFLWIRADRGRSKVEDEVESKSEIENENSTVSRRAILKGGLAAIPALGGGLGAFAILVEPGRLCVAEYGLKIKDLPAGLEGLRIAHLSDFHLGDYIGADHIRRAIAMSNEMNPDVALLTGDYVQGTEKAFEPVARLIAEELKTRHGYVATLGNHDHWHGAGLIREVFASHSIPLIDNDRRFLSVSGFSERPTPDSICVGGVGDFWEDDVDFKRALDGVPETMPRIVLCHNPDVAEMFAGLDQRKRERAGGPSRLDLMLSGHTHGGQVRLPFLGTPITPSRYGPKYAGGLVQGPDWPVLVSRGIGMAMLPVRFGVPPEVVLVRLQRA